MSMESVLEIQQGHLFYRVCGQGEPLVLLHGNFHDHQIWSKQLVGLADHYQVIAYDQRGYGRSSTPQAAFSAVDDLIALIGHLKLEKVTLIGSSSGGALALDCALAYPGLVKRLILAAPSVSGRSYPLRMMWKGMANYRRRQTKGAEEAIEALIADPYWHYIFPAADKPEARTAVLTNIRNPDNFCRIPAKLTASPKPGAWNWLLQLTLPVSVVIGDRDHPYNRHTAEELVKRVPHARSTVFKNCGHLPFVEEPAAFNRLVLEELNFC
jgi:pimeloyl-ACP methyl ester carboxylesterase